MGAGRGGGAGSPAISLEPDVTDPEPEPASESPVTDRRRRAPAHAPGGTEVGLVLASLVERLEALEQAGAPAVHEVLTELRRGLDRLSAESERHSGLARRVAALEQSLDRTSALERAVHELAYRLEGNGNEHEQRVPAVTERVEALDAAMEGLEGRLRGMEGAVTGVGRALEQLSVQVGRLGTLAGRVEALEQAEQPVTAEVVDAVHARLQGLGDRADRIEALLPRLEALERATFGGGPVHRRSRSMVADLDAVEGQVEQVAANMEGLPDRLALLERSTVRTEALERGLAGAVEVIDELVARLAALGPAFGPPRPDTPTSCGDR